MLLLLVILDTERDLKERIELFLEVFGNVELTEKGEADVDYYARKLEDWITSLKPSQTGSVLRYFDVSELKYQEKDELLRVFKSWRKTKALNAQGLWDYRVRKFYGDRYDFRKNLVDWDYHMRLSGKEENVIKSDVSIIHFLHFRKWRMSGMAYEFRDRKYNVPNRTLMSTIASRLQQFKDRNLEAKGASVTAYGYWGDIQNSPFLSFGVTCWNGGDKARLFKRTNKQFEHTAVDVSKANLERFGKAFQNQINSACKLCTCLVQSTSGGVSVRITVAEQHKIVAEPMRRVTLKFATGEKPKPKKTDPQVCDVFVLGCRNAHRVAEVKAGNACEQLCVERCGNLVEVTEEHLANFEERVAEIARGAQLALELKEGTPTSSCEYMTFCKG